MIPRRNYKNVFYIVLFTLLLSSCSTVRKDGPPSYSVDVSRIPNAVPKIEPLSKYGNKPYYVFGKKYYVMKSSKNYEAQGIASWYGTKFHRQRTSSGEPYDMLQMTAAHKTLPLPTYVQVTNLSNGLKIIVKVNDRGPFEGSRLIDLSYAAAKKLGMLGHGTARVDIKAIDPLTYGKQIIRPPVLFTKNKLEPAVYLQVGAFHNKLKAEHLRNRLLTVVPPPIHVVSLVQTGKLYKVEIGPIKNIKIVARIIKQLELMGLHSQKKFL